MKRLAVLSVLALLLSTACAFGEVKSFDRFTLDIPKGWEAKQDGTSVVVQKDEDTGVVITVNPTNGLSAKQLADIFAGEFKNAFKEVSEPEVDEDGDYSILLVDEKGQKAVGILSVVDDEYILVVMSGIERAENEMKAILSSLKEK